MIGTFWKVLLAVGAAAAVFLVLARIFGDKPDKEILMGFLIIVALAIGFECVVEAIKGTD